MQTHTVCCIDLTEFHSTVQHQHQHQKFSEKCKSIVVKTIWGKIGRYEG